MIVISRVPSPPWSPARASWDAGFRKCPPTLTCNNMSTAPPWNLLRSTSAQPGAGWWNLLQFGRPWPLPEWRRGNSAGRQRPLRWWPPVVEGRPPRRPLPWTRPPDPSGSSTTTICWRRRQAPRPRRTLAALPTTIAFANIHSASIRRHRLTSARRSGCLTATTGRSLVHIPQVVARFKAPSYHWRAKRRRRTWWRPNPSKCNIQTVLQFWWNQIVFTRTHRMTHRPLSCLKGEGRRKKLGRFLDYRGDKLRRSLIIIILILRKMFMFSIHNLSQVLWQFGEPGQTSSPAETQAFRRHRLLTTTFIGRAVAPILVVLVVFINVGTKPEQN